MERLPSLIVLIVGMFRQDNSKTSWWPIAVPLGLGLVLTGLAFLWMPWEQVHPNDPSLTEPLGYAPYWSQHFKNVIGAHIDWGEFTVNLLSVWVICAAAAFMLHVANRRE